MNLTSGTALFRNALVCVAALLWAAPASAESPPALQTQPALIAIIIDDLGNQLSAGRRAIALPAPVACAVMPHTAYGSMLAREAHRSGKEVMLHLPMQSMEMQRIAGPGEISLDNGAPELRQILERNLAAVPHVIGVNNHMGSLITRHPGHMRWLMQAIRERGDLFFIDSFTTPGSVAYAMAREGGVPSARRHVFLDDDPEITAVRRQFERLQTEARRRGFAIGIGHPYPSTLEVLEAGLAGLSADQFRLVPVSEIVARLERGDLRREAPLTATPGIISIAAATAVGAQ